MSKTPSFADDLSVDVERRGTAVVVRLIGAAHMNSSSELGRLLTEEIEPDTRRMVLDLSRLQFMSSVGLGGIIGAHARCCRQKAVLEIVHPTPAILELLEVTKLTRLFTIHPTVDAALASD